MVGAGFLIRVGDVVDTVALVAVQPSVTAESTLIEAPIKLKENNIEIFNLGPYLIFFGIVSVF